MSEVSGIVDSNFKGRLNNTFSFDGWWEQSNQAFERQLNLFWIRLFRWLLKTEWADYLRWGLNAGVRFAFKQNDIEKERKNRVIRCYKTHDLLTNLPPLAESKQDSPEYQRGRKSERNGEGSRGCVPAWEITRGTWLLELIHVRETRGSREDGQSGVLSTSCPPLSGLLPCKSSLLAQHEPEG